MAIVNNSSFFRDVNQYTTDLLKKTNMGVEMAATYEKVWDDGFGARGWKLNATLGDPEIIASTRQTGQRLNTSVFVPGNSLISPPLVMPSTLSSSKDLVSA